MPLAANAVAMKIAAPLSAVPNKFAPIAALK